MSGRRGSTEKSRQPRRSWPHDCAAPDTLGAQVIREAGLVATVTAAAFVLAVHFDAFEQFYLWSRQHDWLEIDEIICAFTVLPLGLGWLCWRRLRDADAAVRRAHALNEALAESDVRLNDFASAGSDWFWTMGPDLRFSWFSGDIRDRTQIDPLHIIGKTRAEIGYCEGDKERWASHLDDLNARRPFRDYRYRVRAGGRTIYVSTSGVPVFGDDGSFRGYRGTAADVTAQVRDEEERFRQRAIFEAIFQSVPAAICIASPNREIMLVNPAFRNLFDYRQDEIAGNSTLMIYESSEEFERVGRLRVDAEGTGATKPHPVRYRRKDGSVFWGEMVKTVFRDRHGEVIGYLGITRDITGRRAMEAELLLRTRAIEASTAGVMIAARTGDAGDDQLALTYVNKAFEEITGYARHEALGRNPRFLNRGESQQHGLDVLRTAVREGKPALVTVRNCRKDGTPFWAELRLSPVHDEAGAVTHYLCIQNDVTGKKQTEDELRKLWMVVEQSESSIVVTSVDGLIEYVNPKFCEISGYQRDELIGQTPGLLKSDQMPQRVYKELWETILAGRVWRGELYNRSKSGDLFWEDVKILPIRADEPPRVCRRQGGHHRAQGAGGAPAAAGHP